MKLHIRLFLQTLFVIASALFLVCDAIAQDKKKEERVIGTDKRTGGEAPGDREKMESIREGAQKLKERVERERQEREAQKKSK